MVVIKTYKPLNNYNIFMNSKVDNLPIYRFESAHEFLKLGLTPNQFHLIATCNPDKDYREVENYINKNK